MEGYEVTLTCDLTDYHPSLVEGSIGIILKTTSRLDMFALIEFPEITLDINWSSLKITDPEYIKEKQEEERKMIEMIPNMRKIVYKKGSRGKFYGVDFKCNGETFYRSCHSQERGLKFLKYLDDNNIKYITKII